MVFGLKNKQRVDPSEQAQAYDELRKSKREDSNKNIDKNKKDFYNRANNTSDYIKNPYQAAQNQERDLKGQVDDQIKKQRMESSRVDNPNNPYEIAKRQEKSVDPYKKAKEQSSLGIGKNTEGGGNKFSGASKEDRGKMSDLFRQAKAAKKRDNFFSNMGSQAIAEGQNAISQATSKFLQEAWKNAIDSYGLSILLYVNFHVFCRFVFGPKIFCKLGREWASGKTGGGVSAISQKAPNTSSGGSGGAMGKVGSSVGGKAASCLLGIPFAAIGLAEAALLAIVDIIILFSLLLNLSIWVMIILVLSGDTSLTWNILGALYDLFKSII